MANLILKQVEIARKIDSSSAVVQWNDWKWQVKHAIKDIKTFERLLGIRFPEKERKDLEKTIQRFPLNITPYYLSLINPGNMKRER
jgi:lysine 2,3-aminomutase